ncbi:MAG: glycosyltransferase [Proteobacteria bacterium]|nr:glycosyltransferase [Pseudomonadota bacterium]
MDNTVFFSIVIATYNVRSDLEACIGSINEQVFLDYEVLISDGGSTDGMLDYLSSREIRNLSWYKSEPDAGIYDALNAGIKHVSGKWVLVLGSDDRLADPEALLRAAKLISDVKGNPGVVYSDLFISDSEKVSLKVYPEFEEFEAKYWGGGFIHHQTAFMNSDLLPEIGGFLLDYKVHSDYDLMIRLLKIAGAVKVDSAFVVFHSEGFSSRLRNLPISFQELYNIRRSHGLFPMPPRLLLTIVGLAVRRIFYK